jgi:two-component system, NarL family, nitrate/nitrite sensor histidine kinase NarX
MRYFSSERCNNRLGNKASSHPVRTIKPASSNVIEHMGQKLNAEMNSVHAVISSVRGLTSPTAGLSRLLTPTTSRAGDLKPLLEEFLLTLITTVKATAGVIRILPPQGHSLPIISSVGLPVEMLEAENIGDLDCEARGKVTIGRGIYSADISSCVIRQGCRNFKCQFKSTIAAPLESHAAPDNPIGTLTLFFNIPQETSCKVSKTVLPFANLLGAIIEHNKLNRESKRMDLLAERQSIANEIHDSVAQTLVFARMRTSLLTESIRTHNEEMAAKYASDIDEALEMGQKAARELITEFRCTIDPAGLPQALLSLTEQFRKRNDIALEYTNRAADFELPLEHEIQVYHIVQEALANIAKHSGATHTRLIVDSTCDSYLFTIEDNGSGGCTFSPVEGHYGIMIMRERALRIGGEIKLESSKGFGTLVQLFFPKP